MTLEFEKFFLVLRKLNIFHEMRKEGLRAVNIRQGIGLFTKLFLSSVKSRAQEDHFITVFLQALFSDMLSKLLIIVNLNSKFLNHFDLPQHILVIRSVCGNLVGH